MRCAQVVGKVTLSLCHPTLTGRRYVLAAPLGLTDLMERKDGGNAEIVVLDELGAAPGSLIALSDGMEAANPFRPEDKPIDAYAAAILDDVHVDPAAVPDVN